MTDLVEDVARALYGVLPNYGMVWERGTDTNGTRYQRRVDDTWEEAPDRHADCNAQARAAISVIAARLREPSEDMVYAFARGVLKWDGKYMPTTYREMAESGLCALADHLEGKT